MTEPKAGLRFDRKEIEARLSLLERLAEETSPAGRGETAKGKDRKAFMALLAAGDLVQAVAGWAINHVSGISLADGGRLESGLPDDRAPLFRALMNWADCHDHEKNGCAALETPEEISGEQRQMMLRNLIFGGSAGFPNWLRVEAYMAMDALRFGETLPLFRAGGRGKKARFRELHLQLLAIEIVRFKRTVSGNKSRAVQEVAGRFGVEEGALLTWEKRLPRELGEIEFERALVSAQNHAEFLLLLLRLVDKVQATDTLGIDSAIFDRQRADLKVKLHGDRDLEDAAKAYRALQAMKKRLRTEKAAQRVNN